MQCTILTSGKLLKQISASVCKQTPRWLSINAEKLGTFKVQDDKDFLEKVENSKEPIIVDFFAQYVYSTYY